MELRQLRYFVAAARTLQMTRAAQSFGISQSALSQRILRLEGELDVNLFFRYGPRISLTAAGQRFLPWAVQAIEAIDTGSRDARAAKSANASTIRLGSLPSLNVFLPQVVASFSELHPEVEVLITESSESAGAIFESMLVRDELDLAISGPPASGSELQAHLLMKEPMVVLCPPAHPLSSEPRIDLRMLEHEAFVTDVEGSALRRRLVELCAEAGFAPHISVETARFDTVREMVLAGRGFALLPRIAAGNTPWAMVQSPLATRELCLLSRPPARLSPSGRLLRAYLIDSFRSLSGQIESAAKA